MASKILNFLNKYKKYIIAVAIAVVMVLILAFTASNKVSKNDTTAGAYEDFAEDPNLEVNTLIQTYYGYRASGDVTGISTIAFPVSDMESSYITFLADYIESYDDIIIYNKPGIDENSYLVSVSLSMKFKDIDTPAPGLDFFYLQRNEDGTLIINNVYSAFNQANNEFEMDADIASLIAAYEQQDDVIDLENEVQQKWDEAMAADENLNKFVSSDLQTAMSDWMTKYKALQAQQEAIAQAKENEASNTTDATETADATTNEQTTENTQTTETEKATKSGKLTSKVNVRKTASTDAESLGMIDEGSKVSIYSESNGWTEIDYKGTKAFVKSDYVKVDGDNTTASNDSSSSKTSTDFAKGDKITLKQTVNIRESMSETASKVAVAYQGETVTVQMSYAEGWTKVTYGKKEGYIKTELLK